VGGFTLPAHLRSVAIVHFLGYTVIDVFHRNYQTTSFAAINVGATAAVPASNDRP
jgi:hypothetical protein